MRLNKRIQIVYCALFLVSILLTACGGGGGTSTVIDQTSSYSLGGTISGLIGSVVLQDNSGNNLTVSANGSLTFSTNVASGSTYNVTVLSQPSSQTCSVSSGSGTISGNVTNIAVVCSNNSYTVSGNTTGLTGSLVLQDNAGDNLTIAADGSFTFATNVASGGAYNVTVLTQPSAQTCTVGSGNGTISGNVTNIAVVCSNNSYTVSGNVTGLTGSLVLQDNAGDNLTISADGSFTFSNKVSSGGAYNVTVLTQPSGQTCTVISGSGTILSNVTNVALSCSNNSYAVGGSVTGLTGSVVLQVNGGDNLTISAIGAFTFATSVTNGNTYNVTVLTQPSGQTCSVSTGAGTVSGNNVSNVAVVCSIATYSVGGTVSGLAGSMVLQDNNGNNLSVAANGSFTFATQFANGSPYNVTVLTQPIGQTCIVTGSNGTLTANITNVAVNCGASSLALFVGNMSGKGNLNGIGVAASFNYPSGVATDSAGNVYVADINNNIIRKITPAGVVTTFAGTAGITGSADGTGSVASFNLAGFSPVNAGIATDSTGNVYVSDSGNNTIRKITSAGVVTTLAGTANVFGGSADGTGAAAKFNMPKGIATDSAGNVYVADHGSGTVRMITPAGVVTTLAGTAGVLGHADGTGTAASFNRPLGIATDSTGNVYVSDFYNCIIRKITPAGVVTTLAGTSGVFGSNNGTGAAASFGFPQGIATDAAGNVYVADTKNNIIRKITPAGVVTTLAATASFYSPAGVATDSAGNVYVADTGNNIIRKITPTLAVSTLAGSASVTGSTNGTGTAAKFNTPIGSATDTAGNVYVSDSGNDTIRKITPAGVVTTFAGTAGSAGSVDGTGAAARFSQPTDVATDAANNIYVADYGNSTIRMITPAGVVTTLAGTAGARGFINGTGSAASFNFPIGVATDGAGNVYVADKDNSAIREITPAGVVSTLAGGVYGYADGTGATAKFTFPTGVATDSAGNVYVADLNGDTIRKITPAGVVTTFAGTVGVYGSADGMGAAASFNISSNNIAVGIATDSADNLYVADTNNSTIRKITPAGAVSTVVGVAEQAGFIPGSLPSGLAFPVGVSVSGRSLYITTANGVAVVTNVP